MKTDVILSELQFKAVRSSGAGGQNVNKVSSKVVLTFDLSLSQAFEEAEKGSLEVGKVADFVVTSADLMTVPDNKIPSIKIIATYIDGKSMFKK